MKSILTRKKVGNSFRYFEAEKPITEKSEIKRIDKLAIPPAWENVEIASSKLAKIQARGKDAAGRTQSIYHPDFRLKQDKLKFDRILHFADKLPDLRKQLDRDLARKNLGKEKVLACIVKLIDEAYFRVGNEKYAKEHHSYGVTTLRSKHVETTTNTITFDFIGKSGKEQIKTISDPQLTGIIKRLDELPGYEIFRYQEKDGSIHDLHSSDVNQYIKKYMGEEFTAKDFRTWGGTLLATSLVIKDELEPNASQTARKKAVNTIVKQVAKRLGNTPAIAKSSYIDPRVFSAYERGDELTKLRSTIKEIKPKKYLSLDEQSVLKLLQK